MRKKRENEQEETKSIIFGKELCPLDYFNCPLKKDTSRLQKPFKQM